MKSGELCSAYEHDVGASPCADGNHSHREFQPKDRAQIVMFDKFGEQPKKPPVQIRMLAADWRHDNNLSIHPFGFDVCEFFLELRFGQARSGMGRPWRRWARSNTSSIRSADHDLRDFGVASVIPCSFTFYRVLLPIGTTTFFVPRLIVSGIFGSSGHWAANSS